MANEQLGGPEFKSSDPTGLEQQQPPGTIQIEDENGTIWFVKPDQLSLIPEPTAETPPPEAIPSPEPREPIADDAIRELTTQII